jgi:uracil-DNA glycosylase family 4
MSQQAAFEQLAQEAARCVRCERMCARQAVLSHLNGALAPCVMFIAEAPGRQGADRTRIPFSGDASGANFDALLASIQLERREVFITNSVLCSPRKPSGANDRPTRAEIRNCSDFLRRQIALINPPVIATLGAVALDALRLIEPHPYQLRTDAARIRRWHGRLLVPLYHPSPQVVITVRPLAAQRRDYRVLRRALRLAAAGTKKVLNV